MKVFVSPAANYTKKKPCRAHAFSHAFTLSCHRRNFRRESFVAEIEVFDLAPSQAKATLKDTFDYIASRKRKVVIAIDEFQQIREFPEKGVEALLRSYGQFVPNAHFIFAGSKKHMMDAMFVSSKGHFYQSTQLTALGPIDAKKEAKRLPSNPY